MQEKTTDTSIDIDIDIADDMLDGLWQAQETSSIDIEEVSKKAKSQRNKQRWYIALDLLSLAPLFIVLMIIDSKDYAGPIIPFFLINLVACSIMVIYFIKLRWVSAFSMGKNTHDFTHSLLKQLKNNVIIARVNKHMTWIVGPLMVGFFVLDGYMRDYPIGQLATIFTRVSLLAAVLFIPWYYWCNKRQIRFENEAKELERVLR